MHASPSSPAAAPTKRPLSLGVIFLTLYIDLIGFSIIFPLFPDILKHYLAVDGQSGVLRAMLEFSASAAQALGKDSNFAAVLFGGFLSSIYSLLQFICAPLWGALSDRVGRRGVLIYTVLGTALSYALWVVSGSFWMFIVARLVGGAFGGNISVATAAVADVTTREQRSRAMGLVGAAFGLGLVTGPLVGALTSSINLLETYPALARFGVNPFTMPALVSLAVSLLNLVWIIARFRESLPPEARGNAQGPVVHRSRHPLKAVLSMADPAVRGINLVAFIFALAFCAMEFSLTFLAAQRFGYTAVQNGWLMGFLGIFSIFTQGMLVRRLLKTMPETRVLSYGLIVSVAAFLLIGLAAVPWQLYLGLALVAIGSGLINPASSGLISLYTGPQDQGRVLGVFRSLGSLARAVTPASAAIIFWVVAPSAVFVGAAVLTAVCVVLARKLPQPARM